MSFHTIQTDRVVRPDENTRLGAGKPAQTRAATNRAVLGDVTNVSTARPAMGISGVSRAPANCGATTRSHPTRGGAVAAAVGNHMYNNEAGMPDVDVEMDFEMTNATDAILDIDAGVQDPLLVPEYVNDIFAHYKNVESLKAANPNYMSFQRDINEKMRAILIDWLVEVHLKFKLMPETLYLTINTIDRFLERKVVQRSNLQLVGVTAMLIASKYEEIYAPEIRDFVYITDRAYTREQIIAMEITMLQTLEFRWTTPTAYPFLKRYLKAAQADTRMTQMATYFVERTLQEYRMLSFVPSMIAASAVNMAQRSLNAGVWGATQRHYTGYDEQQLLHCIRTMESIIDHAPVASLKAVYKKWSASKFGAVALASIHHAPSCPGFE